MHWTPLLAAAALALMAGASAAQAPVDGLPTEASLASTAPVAFAGRVEAAGGPGALLLFRDGASSSWAGTAQGLGTRPLGEPGSAGLPVAELGLRAEAEARLRVDDEAGLGLPALEIGVAVRPEARVRADANPLASAALRLAAPDEGEAEIPERPDSRILALRVLDGELLIAPREARGFALAENEALGLAVPPDPALPAVLEAGTYAVAFTAAEWSARGDLLALVEGAGPDGRPGTWLVTLTGGALHGSAPGLGGAFAPSWLLGVDGGVRFETVSGFLRAGPAGHDLLAEPLALTGAYLVEAEGARGERSAPGEASYRVTGRTTGLAFAGLDRDGPAPGFVLLVPAALAAVGLAVWLLEPLRLAAFSGLVPLFSRIADSRLLENEVRDRIHRIVSENPGISIKETMGLAAVGWGTTVYHLRRLEDSRLVTSIRDGNFRRFYRNGAAPGGAKAAIGEMRRAPSQRIAQFLLTNPGACQKEVCAALQLSPPLAHKYLKRLLSANLLASQRDWKRVKYFPTEALQRAAGERSEPVIGAGPVPPAGLGAA